MWAMRVIRNVLILALSMYAIGVFVLDVRSDEIHRGMFSGPYITKRFVLAHQTIYLSVENGFFHVQEFSEFNPNDGAVSSKRWLTRHLISVENERPWQPWQGPFNRDLKKEAMASVSVRLWLLAVALAAYPIVSLIRGPVRRHHRRRRGLCVRCGYNLAGNTTGVCPECGAQR
jgi:hypothetical protein